MDWKTYQRLAMRTKGDTSALRERLTLVNELGDVMWYVTYLLDTLELEMDDVLEANIAKLRARYPDGFDPQRSRNRASEE